MMEEDQMQICNKPECTFSQTGQCVLNNDPPRCPDRLASIADIASSSINISGDIVLTPPEEMERFAASLSLTPRETQKLTRNRYCKIIAILGVPGTGKTASLVSLYLLLAHNKLAGFRFLDSKSVMAFEEISKGSRRWNKGKLPEQLTTHTELQDDRVAGYLHLRLQKREDSRIMDLLLTDLPGEWTSSLIDTDRYDRLGFLKSSDRIWLTVNGEEIANKTSRHSTIHRITLLIGRITTFLKNGIPDMTILVTHCDKTGPVTQYLKPIKDLEDGYNIKIFEIASFSGNENVQPGSGIDELIGDLANMRTKKSFDFWPDTDVSAHRRHMLQFQNNR